MEHAISASDDGDPTARIRRAQWLRAAILGANDGLLSTSSLMLGVGSASEDRRAVLVSGVAGAVAGAFSMAVGEFVSVCTQREIEQSAADEEAAAKAHPNKSPAPPVAPSPGRSPAMRAMVVAAKEEEVVLPSPGRAAAASGAAFLVGSVVPLLCGGFVRGYTARLAAIAGAATVALAVFGGAGAMLGGSRRVGASAARVLVGGWLAMGITYWLLKPLGKDDQ